MCAGFQGNSSNITLIQTDGIFDMYFLKAAQTTNTKFLYLFTYGTLSFVYVLFVNYYSLRCLPLATLRLSEPALCAIWRD